MNKVMVVSILEIKALLAHVVAYENLQNRSPDATLSLGELHQLTDIARGFLSGMEEPVLRLILNEKLHIKVTVDRATMFIACSDLFYFQTEDSEIVQARDLPALLRALEITARYGEMLWVCRKRRMRPQASLYRYLTPDERELFDVAGPLRTDEDGRKDQGPMLVRNPDR